MSWNLWRVPKYSILLKIMLSDIIDIFEATCLFVTLHASHRINKRCFLNINPLTSGFVSRRKIVCLYITRRAAYLIRFLSSQPKIQTSKYLWNRFSCTSRETFYWFSRNREDCCHKFCTLYAKFVFHGD